MSWKLIDDFIHCDEGRDSLLVQLIQGGGGEGQKGHVSDSAENTGGAQ
jgi:hypothetical protein